MLHNVPMESRPRMSLSFSMETFLVVLYYYACLTKTLIVIMFTAKPENGRANGTLSHFPPKRDTKKKKSEIRVTVYTIQLQQNPVRHVEHAYLVGLHSISSKVIKRTKEYTLKPHGTPNKPV